MSRRESAVALTLVALCTWLAVAAPAFYAPDNLRDIVLANLPVLIVAIGATLVILTGDIDISCGSVFAVCSVVAGVLAKETASLAVACLGAVATGAALGAVNGGLVAYMGIPSIVVTLAAMVALRDGLRWATGGTWVADLPAAFQWLGLGQASYPAVAAAAALAVFVLAAWGLTHLAAGRAVYAVGSNPAAARLAGLHVQRIRLVVFVAAGALTAVAAVLNAVRFSQIPTNSGLGLEMKVIAAAVVGGVAVTGGKGTLRGTLLGVMLLSAIGPALTFLGVIAYWERALQGLIILAAVGAEAWRRRPIVPRAAPPGAQPVRAA